jgi:hypothetical protein
MCSEGHIVERSTTVAPLISMQQITVRIQKL